MKTVTAKTTILGRLHEWDGKFRSQSFCVDRVTVRCNTCLISGISEYRVAGHRSYASRTDFRCRHAVADVADLPAAIESVAARMRDDDPRWVVSAPALARLIADVNSNLSRYDQIIKTTTAA
jgi:hypothetical protein